jgi:molybdopterin/thiamine biosynthesis adenylyltransferase
VDDEELLRYSRQIMLPDIDVEGQEKLLRAKVLVVGLGGLGSPIALYLAAAGVGHLVLADDDAVDLSNLQRQIAHGMASIGVNKAKSASLQIEAINPNTQVSIVDYRPQQSELVDLVRDCTLVIDATDNFESRHNINTACWEAKVPLVSGAAIRWEGQVTLFDPTVENSPCYRCLYTHGDDAALNCAENGVVAPLVGIIGTYQALEAVKYLTGVGESLAGYVMYFDGKYSEWRKLKLERRPDCPTCGG